MADLSIACLAPRRGERHGVTDHKEVVLASTPTSSLGARAKIGRAEHREKARRTADDSHRYRPPLRRPIVSRILLHVPAILQWKPFGQSKSFASIKQDYGWQRRSSVRRKRLPERRASCRTVVGVRHRWVSRRSPATASDPYRLYGHQQDWVRDDSKATGRLTFEFVPQFSTTPPESRTRIR